MIPYMIAVIGGYIIGSNKLHSSHIMTAGGTITYEDKYTKFKNRWYVLNEYGDLTISYPFNFKIYLFPNEKGFMVELSYYGKIVGQFHSYVDEDGMMNDVEIDSEFQGIGLGKVLLLKAIEISNIYLGYFESDIRGLTANQKYVYRSLINNKILDDKLNINYGEAQEYIESIIKKIE